MDESDVAKRILKRIAPVISVEHDKFGGWLAAGSGAGLGLLIGNSEKMLSSIYTEYFIAAAILILISLLLYTWQRWTASRLVAALAAGDAVVEVQKETGPLTIDTSVLIQQMANRSIWPFNRVMMRAASKGIEPETQLTHMAQRQTWLVILQVFFVGAAIVTLLFGIAD